MENICIKIVWDLGEYEVQDKDNYSYEIIDPYLEGCKRYNVYGQFRHKTASIFGGCRKPANWINDSRRLLVNGTFCQSTNSPCAFNPNVEFVTELLPPNSQACNPRYRLGYRIREYTDNQCSNLREYIRWIVSSVNYYELISIDYEDVTNNNQSPPIKLKIIDGGIESLHSINDKNSVQIAEYECGCPSNQLDCGDCCLDCNSIFNQISSIRALVRRLK